VPGLGIKSEVPNIEEHGFLNSLIFLPENLRTVTVENKTEVGKALALNTCSNCHSLTDTGIRPITKYFGENVSESEIAQYLRAALSSGTTLYMPEIPLKQDEATALAAFIRQLKDQSNAVAATDSAPVTVAQSSN
jgi:mono/diheme cytochrome c family protein